MGASKRALTPENAKQCTVLPHIPACKLINDDAGQGAGPGPVAQPRRPPSEAVAVVTNGRLDFGAAKRISYGESDGRRRNGVVVKT